MKHEYWEERLWDLACTEEKRRVKMADPQPICYSEQEEEAFNKWWRDKQIATWADREGLPPEGWGGGSKGSAWLAWMARAQRDTT